VLQASASVRLLFVKVSGDVTIELSSNPPERIDPIPDLPQRLKDELTNSDNLRVEGEDRSVIFAAMVTKKEDKLKLLAPVGELIWEQKRAPLNLDIEKVEGIQLNGWHKLVVKSELGEASPELENPEMDWFGVGTFMNLGDSEALNNGRFEQQQSGVRISATSMREGALKEAELKINLIKLPKRSPFFNLSIRLYASSALASILRERSSGAQMPESKAGVTVAQESWNHHSSDGKAQNAKPLNSVQAFVATKQNGGIALPATEKSLSLTGVL
jgi:hypothetical protein